eukprot:g1177.t1
MMLLLDFISRVKRLLNNRRLEEKSQSAVIASQTLRRGLLCNIETFVICRTSEEADSFRLALLQLLDHVLLLLEELLCDDSKVMDRADFHTCKRLVIVILQRREFTLEAISFDCSIAASNEASPDLSKSSEVKTKNLSQPLPAKKSSLLLLNRYRKLLARSMLVFSDLVREDVISREEALRLGCSTILSLCFYRLSSPFVKDLIYRCFEVGVAIDKIGKNLNNSDLASNERIMRAFEVSTRPQKIMVVAEEDEKNLQNFQNLFPSLFYWNWFAKLDETWEMNFTLELQKRLNRANGKSCDDDGCGEYDDNGEKLKKELSSREILEESNLEESDLAYLSRELAELENETEENRKFQESVGGSWLGSELSLLGQEGFMRFFESLCKQIIELDTKKSNLLWYAIPGFEKLSRHFIFLFADMARHLSVSRTSLQTWKIQACRATLECSTVFITNTSMLNVLLCIAFENTNLYSLKDVANCISLLEMWFTIVSSQLRKDSSAAWSSNMSASPFLCRLTAEMRAATRTDLLNNQDNQEFRDSFLFHRRFMGSNVESWLVSQSEAEDIEKAKEICLQLYEAGMIEKVTTNENGLLEKSESLESKTLQCNKISGGGMNMNMKKVVIGSSEKKVWDTNASYRLVPNSTSLFQSSSSFPLSSESSISLLPSNFNMAYFKNAILTLLKSEHFQIVMKTLTFLYNHNFNGRFRKELFEEIFKTEIFFSLFLHWMHEVRRFFFHILIWKLFHTSRLWLSCSCEKIMLEEAEKKNQEEQSRKFFGLGAFLSSNGNGTGLVSRFLKAKERVNVMRGGRNQLLYGGGEKEKQNTSSWWGDMKNALTKPSIIETEIDKTRHQFMIDSLEDEEKALDLLLCGKLNHYLSLIMSQASDSTLQFFHKKWQPYAQKAIHEYTIVLQQYFVAAKRSPENVPKGPLLQFNLPANSGSGGTH